MASSAASSCSSLPEAESAYRAAIALDPVAAEPYLQLGHALKMRGRREEAQIAYLQALALQRSMPDPLSGLNSLGWPEAQTAQLATMADRHTRQDGAEMVRLIDASPVPLGY